MDLQFENPSAEIRRLERCINDLVSVLALPAIWSGAEPSQIIRTLLDSLLRMLRLNLVYVRLKDPLTHIPTEMIQFAPSQKPNSAPEEICQTLNQLLGNDPQKWPRLMRNVIGGQDMSIVPLPLGLQGEIGVIVAGSERADFPEQTERLLLSVAANQTLIGLQEARLLSHQKRLASELDQRVAQRTVELGQANEELRMEIADRRFVEKKLRQEEIERKQSEEQLRRSEAYLAEAQRLSLTGSFGWNVPADEHFWSKETFRIFEYDPSTKVTLKLILDRVHPQDVPLMKQVMALAAGRGDLDYECRLLMPSGSVKYLHIVGHATKDKLGRMEYIGAVQDVTDRRLSEETLGKVRSELARVARATSFGALTASIAHEVNQPLSGIITNASTCLRMLAADPPNVDGARETAKRTIRDGHRASDVITRLRALFSKKDATTESVDLNEAIHEVIALSCGELQRNGAILHTDLADDLPTVTGDRVQLQQVMLNLLLNASEAMSEIDNRPRELAIRTECDTDGDVRLSVRDAGVGLDPHAADKLFDAFFTTKSAGMGIGLSVSRSIIESHRGRLWATPNDGPGATFSFSIPCESLGKTSAHPAGESQSPPAINGEKQRRRLP